MTYLVFFFFFVIYSDIGPKTKHFVIQFQRISSHNFMFSICTEQYHFYKQVLTLGIKHDQPSLQWPLKQKKHTSLSSRQHHRLALKPPIQEVANTWSKIQIGDARNYERLRSLMQNCRSAVFILAILAKLLVKRMWFLCSGEAVAFGKLIWCGDLNDGSGKILGLFIGLAWTFRVYTPVWNVYVPTPK